MQEFDFNAAIARMRLAADTGEIDTSGGGDHQKRHSTDVWAADGVPLRARQVVMGGIMKTLSVDAVDAWDGKRWAMVLMGGAGVGKTVAAAHWCRGMTKGRVVSVRGGHTKRYWTARELSQVSQFGGEIVKIQNVKHLVIDELGREYLDKSGYARGILEGVLSHRHGADLKTLVCTNLTMAELKQRYDAMIIDRLREDATVVSVGGNSLRGRR